MGVLIGAAGIIGTVGTTGVTGEAEPKVWFKGICATDEDGGGEPCDVDGELGELGTYRKRILSEVERLGKYVTEVKIAG